MQKNILPDCERKKEGESPVGNNAENSGNKKNSSDLFLKKNNGVFK